MATEVYMPWECTLKIGTNGVNSTDEQMEVISDFTSVSHSTSYEKDEWYAMPNNGKKTSIVISKEDALDVQYKVVKNDSAGRYLVEVATIKTGSDAMTRVTFIDPYGFKFDGSATVEISDKTFEGNKVPDLKAKLTFSGAYTVTDTTKTEVEGA